MGKDIVNQVIIYLQSPNETVLRAKAQGNLNVRGLLIDEPIDDNLGRRTDLSSRPVPAGSPPPPPGTIDAPPPTLGIEEVVVPTPVYYYYYPGPTYLHITAGVSSTPGAQLYKREIQQARDGVNWSEFPPTPFGDSGDRSYNVIEINSVNYPSSYRWVLQRYITFLEDDFYRNAVPTPPEPGLIQHTRVRDLWRAGGLTAWSTWVEITVNFRPGNVHTPG